MEALKQSTFCKYMFSNLNKHCAWHCLELEILKIHSNKNHSDLHLIKNSSSLVKTDYYIICKDNNLVQGNNIVTRINAQIISLKINLEQTIFLH